MRPRLAFTIVLALVSGVGVLLGCGDSNDPVGAGAGAADASAPGQDGAIIGPDGAILPGPPGSDPDGGGTTPEGGATVDAAGNVAYSLVLGILQATQKSGGSDVEVATENANFVEVKGQAECPPQVIGTCRITRCAETPGAKTRLINAGAMKWVGGSTGATSMMYVNAGTGGYPQNIGLGRWRGGDNVAISAIGAEVPAFSLSFPFPSRPIVTAPIPSLSGTIEVDRTKDLKVEWTTTGTPNGDTQIVVAQDNPGELALTALCKYPASAGSALVPAALLALLKPTDGANKTTIGTFGGATVTVKAGTFDVTANAIWGAGGYAAANAIVQ